MEKYEKGLNKKSFSIYYNGGEIWAEHLDSLEDKKSLVIEKFKEDLKIISRPSTSSYIIVNLDETVVTDDIIELILNSFINLGKPLKKVAFVGLSSKYKRYIKKKSLPFVTACIDDYEKAIEWTI